MGEVPMLTRKAGSSGACARGPPGAACGGALRSKPSPYAQIHQDTLRISWLRGRHPAAVEEWSPPHHSTHVALDLAPRSGATHFPDYSRQSGTNFTNGTCSNT